MIIDVRSSARAGWFRTRPCHRPATAPSRPGNRTASRSRRAAPAYRQPAAGRCSAPSAATGRYRQTARERGDPHVQAGRVEQRPHLRRECRVEHPTAGDAARRRIGERDSGRLVRACIAVGARFVRAVPCRGDGPFEGRRPRLEEPAGRISVPDSVVGTSTADALAAGVRAPVSPSPEPSLPEPPLPELVPPAAPSPEPPPPELVPPVSPSPPSSSPSLAVDRVRRRLRGSRRRALLVGAIGARRTPGWRDRARGRPRRRGK